MFSSGLVPVVSACIVFLDGGAGGGVQDLVNLIMKTLNGVLDAMGGTIVEMLNKALTTFAPILLTMSVVWLAINLYQRFTARAGR